MTSTKSNSSQAHGGGSIGGLGQGYACKAKNFRKSFFGLIRCFKPFRIGFGISIFFAIIASITTILGPIFIQKITDDIFNALRNIGI